MDREPKCGKVGEEFFSENLIEIDFQIGRPGKAYVVPENAKFRPVGNNAPESLVGSVEIFLNQIVRSLPFSLPSEFWDRVIEFEMRTY